MRRGPFEKHLVNTLPVPTLGVVESRGSSPQLRLERERELDEVFVLVRNAGKSHSRSSSAVSLRNLTVFALILRALSTNSVFMKKRREASITNSSYTYSRSNSANRLKNFGHLTSPEKADERQPTCTLPRRDRDNAGTGPSSGFSAEKPSWRDIILGK